MTASRVQSAQRKEQVADKEDEDRTRGQGKGKERTSSLDDTKKDAYTNELAEVSNESRADRDHTEGDTEECEPH
jgi:hypothetical protein